MTKKRFLVLLSQLCPACNIARRWPNSQFAKKLAQAEKNCPACNAYKELFVKKNPAEG